MCTCVFLFVAQPLSQHVLFVLHAVMPILHLILQKRGTISTKWVGLVKLPFSCYLLAHVPCLVEGQKFVHLRASDIPSNFMHPLVIHNQTVHGAPACPFSVGRSYFSVKYIHGGCYRLSLRFVNLFFPETIRGTTSKSVGFLVWFIGPAVCSLVDRIQTRPPGGFFGTTSNAPSWHTLRSFSGILWVVTIRSVLFNIVILFG